LATLQAAGRTQAYVTFFVAAACLYLIISLVSLRLFGALEAYVRRGQPKFH
jgi:polar amino acid transport system permease protein